MSEYRKYRLISKFAEINGLHGVPQKYVAMISAESGSEHPHYESRDSPHGRMYSSSADSVVTLQGASEAAKLLGKVEYACQLISEIAGRSEVPLRGIAPDHVYEKGPEATLPALPSSKRDLPEGNDNFQGEALLTRPFVDSKIKICNAAQSLFSGSEICLPTQELLMVEDLLSLLLGVPGHYIYFDAKDPQTLLVDESISISLIKTVLPILHMSQSCQELRRFCDEFALGPLGRVGQAFVAAIRAFLLECDERVLSLEKKLGTGALGLQSLFFHLLPVQKTVFHVHELVDAVRNKRIGGGAIIVHIEAYISSYAGDQDATRTFRKILSECARPFMVMLSNWITTGNLESATEFFIVREAIPDGQTIFSVPWTKNDSLTRLGQEYALRESHVPEGLSHCAPKILQLGALINVLKSFGDDGCAAIPKPENLPSFQSRAFGRMVDGCLVVLNQQILSRLRSNDRLRSNLRQCKNVYFGGMRSILESFLHSCQEELSKPVTLVSKEHVCSVWEQSLRAGGFWDEYSSVEIVFNHSRLHDQLQHIFGSKERTDKSTEGRTTATGLEVLSTRLSFGYPDNIIFTNEIQAKYDLIFRFAFRLLTLAHSLNGHRFRRDSPPPDRRRLDILRRQMLNFVSVVHQYFIYDVLVPNWDNIANIVYSAIEVTQVIEKHSEFLDMCLRLAGLTNSKLIERYDALFSHIQQFVSDPPPSDSKLDAHSKEFNELVRGFLAALEYFSSRDYDYHLSILFGRIDHNSFYYSSGFGAKSPLLTT